MANTTAKRTEWIAVVHGQNGTWKIAARNTAALAQLLKEQTQSGNMIASVYEREEKTYAEDGVGR